MQALRSDLGLPQQHAARRQIEKPFHDSFSLDVLLSAVLSGHGGPFSHLFLHDDLLVRQELLCIEEDRTFAGHALQILLPDAC